MSKLQKILAVQKVSYISLLDHEVKRDVFI